MLSPLSDAVARCRLRRLRNAAAGAPLPASVTALAIALAPLAVARAGRALGVELAGAEDARGVANAIVLGPVLGAAVGGATLAIALPPRSALGAQIAGAPLRDRAVMVALLAVPLAGLSVVVLPSLVAGCVALGAELTGGSDAGIALAAAVVAAALAGAVVAEGGVALARGCMRRAMSVGAGAGGWAALGSMLGNAPLGPLASVSESLRDEGSAWPAIALVTLTGLALAFVWVRLASTRPLPRVSAPRHARRLVRGRSLAAAGAVAAILGRRREVRLSAAGALVFGWGGLLAAGITAAPVPAGFLLGATTALLGAVLAPLVACGALLEGRWLWAAAPKALSVTALSAVAVAIAFAAVPGALVAVVAVATVGTSSTALGAVAGLTVVAAAVALVAGALVPWHGEAAGDQITTFAAFVAVAALTSLVVAALAPRVVSLGAPDAAVAAVLSAVAVASATLTLAQRLERPTR